MNFIFISPNFPVSYWNFCDRLHKGGANVLGIGDAPYDNLEQPLKNSLTEYYRVNNLESYDEVFRAVAYFSFKYGKIDWLESNNEYWLEQDARLRTDFNIKTGVNNEGIERFKSKAAMKIYYAKGGIPTARQHKVTDIDSAIGFISLVGYPVVAKPEIGVGAAETFKLCDENQVRNFFNTKPNVPYVMEEFIYGDIYSYDAIVDSNCNPLFESSAKFPPSVMDIVNKRLDLCYYVLEEVPEALRLMGRDTVKAFGVGSRFVHFEFFRLTQEKPGLGKVGDFVALEVNMRPAGGYTPDMINFAHSVDVYQIWADMVLRDKTDIVPGESHLCVYYGRRDGRDYVHSDQEVMQKYGGQMAMCMRMSQAISPAMGDRSFTAHIYGEEAKEEFIEFMSALK
ncbi:MAG: acetyl-CoA carboxylase biotin carboxylase subunit family protein [Candidatus Cryptobacteroides sp.]